RIWLSLDKDKRQEIDSRWCLGDGLLYVSAISIFGALFWLVALLFSLTGWPDSKYLPLHSRLWCLAASISMILVGNATYFSCLPFQRSNGVTFKVIFDLYRPAIGSLFSWGPDESARWRAAWAYLQYQKIECVVCGGSYFA